jgi:glutaconate CoA-transferase, subunit A
MPSPVPLGEAIAAHVHDGDTVALEGFTHLIPFAAAHEIARQGRRHLTLVRMTPDLVYDQLIGLGVADELVFSYGGNPGVGSLHRLRDAVEKHWPHRLVVHEHSHAGLANAYVAGAARLPFAVLRGYRDTDLEEQQDIISRVTCPFTGEELAAVKAVNPDVAVIHAQVADRDGNVMLWGITGVQREAVLAAKRAIVTVEEVVDAFPERTGAVVLPNWVLSAVSVVPGGAWPSYAAGYSVRDNDFYKQWDAVSRDRTAFLAWAEQNGLPTTHAAHPGERMQEAEQEVGARG